MSYKTIFRPELKSDIERSEQKPNTRAYSSYNTPSLLLTVDQLANYLHVHPVTIRKWVAAKKIPYYRFSSALRFDLDEVLTAAALINKEASDE